MKTETFFIITAKNLTENEAEILAAEAFENGASGTEEQLSFEQKSRQYEPVTISRERTTLKIYFEVPPELKWFESLKILFPAAEFELQSEKNQDWLAEWKKGFNPFELANGVWIVPSWCQPPVEARQMIRIDPGMAFGTGTHETTRLASQLLGCHAKTILQEGHGSVLDVGTGTGILAFLSEHLGFQSILGNDIDPEARRVARENLALNSFKKIKIIDEDLNQIPNVFGLVIANIIDGVLVQLQPELKKRVTSAGYLLLTGILQERESLFLSEFSFEGYDLIERDQVGEWVGFLLKKKMR
jgi:ribosomal protein L11 methyltransferase